MFDVTLFSNFSKPENSTKQPSGGETFPCQMVEPCGVINPNISFNQGVDWNPSEYNYAQIPVFGRYYWITEWTFNHGRWYANMKVDVLASWKDNILSMNEYVVRSASNYNGEIIDTLYPANTIVDIQTEQFYPWPAFDLANGAYVVGVLGNNQSTVGGVGYYVASADNLNTLVRHMMESTEWLNGLEAAKDIGEDLLKCLVNPMQYITSVMWLPFMPWETGHSSAVWAGWWNTNVGLPDCGSNAPYLGGSCGVVSPHPQADRGLYLNKTPFTEIILEFPPFGKITLDPYRYPVGSDIRFSIATDAVSGMATLHIYTKKIGDGDMLQCKIGVDLSVGQATSSMLGAAGAAISAVPKSSIFTGVAGSKIPEIFGAAGGKLSNYGIVDTSAIGNAVSSLNPELNVIGQNGGTAIYSQPASLTIIHHRIVEEDLLHYGRPLCEKILLNTLNGYTELSHADVNIPCTNTEKTVIKAFMEGGFFIE